MYSMIHSVTLQWSMSQDILKEVDGYYWYCKCKDYKTAPTKIVSISYSIRVHVQCACACVCAYVYSPSKALVTTHV